MKKLLLLISIILFSGLSAMDKPSAKSRTSSEAIFWSIQDNNISVLKKLLQKNPDLEVYNKTGETPLIVCVNEKKHDMLKILLEAGAKPNTASTILSFDTALIRAIKADNPIAVDLLLKAHADPNQPNKYHKTPLTFACGKDHPNAAIIRMLMRAGAVPSLEDLSKVKRDEDNVEAIQLIEDYFKKKKLV